ncbi:MAG: RelA/SpoT domain-containing protein [Ignavibacteriaceae bacterium]
MNSNPKISFVEILSKFESNEDSFINILHVVDSYLNCNLPSLEILPQITSRIKDPISIYKKLLKKGIKYEDIYDILGFRIICHFPSEVERVNQFIAEHFIIEEFEKKIDNLKFDQLGYTSDHFNVRIKANLTEFIGLESVSSLIFEIQVRTLCQHTWADIEHALLYKQDMPLEDNIKRKVFRLTSLLEICDQEFEDVNQKLINHPDYNIYSILKKLEGKFFKYAKRDYDKETSIKFLSVLSPLILNLSEDLSNLIAFISNNDKKIQQIFCERIGEIERNIYFSQPEIFLIWFLVENNKYPLIQIWSDNYFIGDLEELSIWWGIPIGSSE